jgi:hypothetical protein
VALQKHPGYTSKRAIFNPASNEFAFGFLVQILSPILSSLCCCWCWPPLPAGDCAIAILSRYCGCGLLAWLALELPGPFVSRKCISRFAILPLATVTFCLGMRGDRGNGAVPVTLADGRVRSRPALSSRPCKHWRMSKEDTYRQLHQYYREPFHMVVQHSERKRFTRQVR